MTDPIMFGLSDELAITMSDQVHAQASIVYSACLARLAEHEQRELNRNAVITDEIKKDLRWKMGYIAALEFSAKLPQEISERVQKRGKQ